MACLSYHSHCCWNALPTSSLCSHPLFGIHKRWVNITECQWEQLFLHRGIHWYICDLYALPCSTWLYQTASLLPYVTWQPNILEYWWEGTTSTAVQPTSDTDIVGHHDRIGGIAFAAILIYSKMCCFMVFNGYTCQGVSLLSHCFNLNDKWG